MPFLIYLAGVLTLGPYEGGLLVIGPYLLFSAVRFLTRPFRRQA
jgi:hypothetical protein